MYNEQEQNDKQELNYTIIIDYINKNISDKAYSVTTAYKLYEQNQNNVKETFNELITFINNNEYYISPTLDVNAETENTNFINRTQIINSIYNIYFCNVTSALYFRLPINVEFIPSINIILNLKKFIDDYTNDNTIKNTLVNYIIKVFRLYITNDAT
jgi:hypothetical protein